MLLSVFPIFAPLQPEKIIFAAVFFIRYVCEYLIYRKTPKSVLFAVCSRFFLFPLSLAFCFTKIVRETLCKFLYIYAGLKCMFMQSIMVNRKLFGKLEFSAPLQKRYIFLLFVSLLFLLFWIIYRKRKQKRKSLFLPFFAVKCPFLSQIMY